MPGATLIEHHSSEKDIKKYPIEIDGELYSIFLTYEKRMSILFKCVYHVTIYPGDKQNRYQHDPNSMSMFISVHKKYDYIAAIKEAVRKFKKIRKIETKQAAKKEKALQNLRDWDGVNL